MLSSYRIMQYFKNSICIKGPRLHALKFTISALQKWIVQIQRATYVTPTKNPPPTRTTSNNFTNYSVRPANLHNSRNNRISNVCTMVSQKLFENKKSASIFFSIVPNQPAWPQIYAADHRGLNVVAIYFMFLFYALGWQTLPLTLSHAQIFK